MNLQYLKSFIVLSKYLNFSKAAEALYISQPALTKQIKDLERELNCTLFERTTRSMQLSQSGHVCLKYAMQMMSCADNMEREIANLNQGCSGSIRIGYITQAHALFIKSGLKEIIRKHPDVVIETVKKIPGDVINGLRTGELDCGFLHLPSVKNRGLAYKTVRKGGVVVRIPEGSELVNKEILVVDDIKDMLVVSGKNISLDSHRYTNRCFARYGVVPRTVYANSEESIEILMNTMNGISFTSEFSPEIPGYKNKKIAGFEKGFDLVLARNKSCTNKLVDEFYNALVIYDK